MRFVASLILLLGLALPACDDGPHRAVDETPQKREHEVLSERTSGFWTSNKPAEGGAYRWRLLAIGGGLIAITGFGMRKLIRRANDERKNPPPRPWDKPTQG